MEQKHLKEHFFQVHQATANFNGETLAGEAEFLLLAYRLRFCAAIRWWNCWVEVFEWQTKTHHVIFIDEIDAMGRVRNGTGSGASEEKSNTKSIIS